MKEIKKLGFGFMRLPQKNGEIDTQEVKQMVDIFIKKGFNYFDTAFGYHGGKSEVAIKEALVDRYNREDFILATKLPAWTAKSEAIAKEMFETSLLRTGAGYFDYFLLHNVGSKRTKFFEEFNIWEYLKEKKSKGLIKNLGFSFHDTADALEILMEKHHQDIDFIQLQINYVDWEDKTVQSKKCYEIARKFNKPIIIMEPIRGGELINLPKVAADIFKEYDENRSFAEWALRYAASFEGVVTVLSGMSNLKQLEENTDIMKNFTPLSEEEQKVINKVQKAFLEIERIPCTACKYCVKDCPAGIEISDVLNSMNINLVFGNLEAAKVKYTWALGKGAKASDCIKCGLCESVCPQYIKVMDELERISNVLEQ